MPYCSQCGTQVPEEAKFCPECGARIERGYQREYHADVDYSVSDKSMIIAALLCFFMGYLGAHRFYVGKIGTGILYLLTVGFFGIGALVDFIVIICGGFRDAHGLVLKY